MKKQKRGFTLVEILATVVLLGLISLIVFPKILEMIEKNTNKLDSAKLNVLYQGVNLYLIDEGNAYPRLEGNTFCIRPADLVNGNYVAIDIDDLDDTYVVRAVVEDEEKLSFSYVSQYDCIEKGVIIANLEGVACDILTNGYAYNKQVRIQYPTGNEFEYSYSFDLGETWKKFSDEKKDGINDVVFNTNGYIIARVKKKDVSGYKSCTANVNQVDKTEVGSIIAYSGTDVPKGYLLANGKEISRKAYASLFSKIGVIYGSGNGNTTFNIPDMMGRTIVGAASDVSYASSVGEEGGEVTHKLSENELPRHTHTFTGKSHSHTFTGSSTTTSTSSSHTHGISGTTASAGGHTHTGSGTSTTAGYHSHTLSFYMSGSEASKYGLKGSPNGFANRVYIVTSDSYLTSNNAANNHSHNYSGTTSAGGKHSHNITIALNTAGAHTHSLNASGSINASTATGTNSTVGGGEAHENTQPYMTMQYLIKYQ